MSSPGLEVQGSHFVACLRTLLSLAHPCLWRGAIASSRVTYGDPSSGCARGRCWKSCLRSCTIITVIPSDTLLLLSHPPVYIILSSRPRFLPPFHFSFSLLFFSYKQCKTSTRFGLRSIHLDATQHKGLSINLMMIRNLELVVMDSIIADSTRIFPTHLSPKYTLSTNR